MTMLLSRYPVAASDGQPLYNAYEVVTEPRFPNPEIKAVAIATPISPCLLRKILAPQDIVVGTVAPSPKPQS